VSPEAGRRSADLSSQLVPRGRADIIGNLQMDPNIKRRPKQMVTKGTVTRIQMAQMAIQKNQT
jgi:hypothetical protein